MSVVIRYFAPSGAGAADGTTWADRAPLFTAGAWSTIITGFDFTTNSLECRIGPGSYTCSVSIVTATFTVVAPAPSAGQLYLFGADSSGNKWSPDYTWTSAQPATWVANLPQITHTINGPFAGQGGTNCFGLAVIRTNASFSSGTAAPFTASNVIEWCYAEVSASTSLAAAFTITSSWGVSNCVGKMTGTQYQSVFSGTTAAVSWHNCRAEGNASATFGSRAGFYTSSNGLLTVSNCTALNTEVGIQNPNAAAGRISAIHNTVYSVTTGVSVPLASTSGGGADVNQNFIVCSGTGISLVTNHGGGVHRNRIRAGTALSVVADQINYDNNTDAGIDADEFVDAAGGDLRIKSGSTYWGGSYGAGDQIGSSGGLITSRSMNGGYTA